MSSKKNYLKTIIFGFLLALFFYFFISPVLSGESDGYDECTSCGGKEEPGGYEPPPETTTPPPPPSPYCGDGSVGSGEQCEYPSTNNNAYCTQTTSSCSGNKTGTRDNKGNCDSGCQCSYDSFTYSCVKDSCGAECVVNSDCPNKCVNSVRYYNGQCGSTSCACTFSKENCNGYDTWVNITDWICDGSCKRYKTQEYRDYSCLPDGCTYAVTDTRNITENAPADTVCSGGSFVNDIECDSSAYYCSNETMKKKDHFRCDGFNQCDDFWYSDQVDCGPSSDTCDSLCVKKHTYTCSVGVCGNYHTDTNCAAGKVCYDDACKSVTTEHYCTKDNICYDENTKRTRYYGCEGTGNTNCESTVRINSDYDCGDTTYTCNGDCARNHGYTCESGGCGSFSSAEQSPAGKHCVDGSFTSTGYCDFSDSYCSNDCSYKIDRYECSAAGVCDKLDFSDSFYCPNNTVCSSGSCVSDLSCGSQNVCKDQCSSASKLFRCNGAGGCNSFWKYEDELVCSPYKCISNVCSLTCYQLCGAECDSNDDCGSNSCSETFNDYCSGNKLVEYDSDKVKDSTTVTNSCSNSCKSDCSCTDCSPECNPPDTRTYCVKGVCGAECAKDSDCNNYCVNGVRHFSGDCQSDCLCSYNTEDCNAQDGWYNTTQKRSNPCADNLCQTCEEIKQEYKDCSCAPSGCQCKVTATRWIASRRRDVVCKSGKVCQEGRCVYLCEGDVDIIFEKDPFCPNTRFRAKISGLSHCNPRKVYLREDSCSGETLASCKLGKRGCATYLKMSEIGTHTVVACLDKNGDGDYEDFGEQETANVSISCHFCMSKLRCNYLPMCGGWCEITDVCMNKGEFCL